MFRVDTTFDGMPAMHDWTLQYVGHLGSGRDHELTLDQIHIGDHFRDRMFDLNAGVHLDKVQAAILIHQELDGACILVSDRTQCLAQHLANLLAQFGSDLDGG